MMRTERAKAKEGKSKEEKKGYEKDKTPLRNQIAKK